MTGGRGRDNVNMDMAVINDKVGGSCLVVDVDRAIVDKVGGWPFRHGCGRC